MKRLGRRFVTVAMASVLALGAVFGTGSFGIRSKAASTETEVGARSYDQDYCLTHGTGLTFDADGTAKLGTIANGDSALFKDVEIGTDYRYLQGIIFNYSKPHNYTVTVKIRLDSENGPLLGEF